MAARKRLSSAARISRDIRQATEGSHSMGPGTVSAQRRSAQSTRKWARESGYKPRTRAQINRAPINRVKPLPQPGTVSTARRNVASTAKWATAYKPRTAAAIARAPIGNGTPLGAYGARQAGAASGPIAGAARVIGTTVGGIASAVYHEPIESQVKAFGTLKDAFKAIPQTAVLAGGLASYPVRRALRGFDDPEGGDAAMVAAGEMAKGAVDRVSSTYGPSYRGEKGSGAKLRKQIRKEGPLLATMDLATVAIPTSAALGAGARAGVLGTGARTAATKGTKIRYGFEAEPRELAPRRSGIGIAARAGHNTARRAVQRRAEKQAIERTRVTVARRLGLDVDEKSLAYKAPKPLAAHRSILGDDELAPLSDKRASRNQRFRVANEDYKIRVRGIQRVQKHVKRGLIAAQRMVPEELRPVIAVAHQLGIRKPEDVEQIVPARIAEIDARTAEARAGKGEHAAHDRASVDMDELATERLMLVELLKTPEVFDRPDVQASVEAVAAVTRAAVGGREGIGTAQLAEGRTGLQGGTVGVVRASELNKAARQEQEAARKEARTEVKRAREDFEQTTAKAKLRIERAHRDVERARGRAEVLSRNVSGRNTLKGAGTDKYPAGGHGVRQAEAKLHKVQDEAMADVAAARAAREAAKEQRRAVNAVALKKIDETPEEYAARVDAAFAARGLAAPGYTTSKYAEDIDQPEKRSDSGGAVRGANPLGKTRHGTNYRLGHQAHEPETAVRDMRSIIERGAKLEGENNLMQRVGLYFNSDAEAQAFMRGLGMDKDSIVLWEPRAVRKDTPGLVLDPADPRKDMGDYVATHGGVFAIPKAVADELNMLSARPSAVGTVLRRLAHAPQTALLALSPSWWIFQRVNDVIGAAFGGSLHKTVHLQKTVVALRKDDEDAADIVEMLAGGGMSGDILTPKAGQKLGRAQRAIDENASLREAWTSDGPATALLYIGKKAPMALMRSDAAVTSRVRQGQYLHNLAREAAKMDPDAKRVARGLAPMGHALKTGDTALIARLLKDPEWERARDEAAESLSRIMGDWHTYTARERNVKDFAAFYGFLRYSTRMVFYTLPVDHPHMALLIGQLGNMNAEYAKSIIGDDLPYGLGALYDKSGKVVADLTRANPLTGPLMSLDKPESLINLSTPLVSIITSAVMGVNVGLSDSATGYLKKVTTNGNSKDTSLTMADRLQILGDRTLSLLSPYKMAKKATKDGKESDDSLLWDRQPLIPNTAAEKVKLDQAREMQGKGGWRSIFADTFPMFMSDGRNVAELGKKVSKAKGERDEKALLDAAKAKGVRTELGQARIEMESVRERIKAEMEEAAGPNIGDQIRAEIERELIAAGLR